ncbi:PepSY-associated TM helix domain-containing protein [Microbulbifer thermotolerans]|uniref:PepSY-associated TM helix domain-containing protein n=1 Tax=Microbulbifer thermotolerans TaxID=252514 RepID=UPI002672719B|nr:PepSY-associated TM helix domain-containing protein [Microbulbifer thermotolerans]WKT61660.1 PepSY-associated TM helix domain-containing protein [Microbulbifer thermotolerans]
MGFSVGTVRQWHWVSSAICLAAMLLFAITGITLNHAAEISAEPQVISYEVTVPAPLLAHWLPETEPQLPANLVQWLAEEHQIQVPRRHSGEWDGGEFYLAMPRPGGDAWLSLDTDSGELIYEDTDRGWIAYLNDLHKGRDSGPVWKWFLDIFAAACVVFCLTGFWLLWQQSPRRPSTWPLTALGIVIPLVIALVFIH